MIWLKQREADLLVYVDNGLQEAKTAVEACKMVLQFKIQQERNFDPKNRFPETSIGELSYLSK